MAVWRKRGFKSTKGEMHNRKELMDLERDTNGTRGEATGKRQKECRKNAQVEPNRVEMIC